MKRETVCSTGTMNGGQLISYSGNILLHLLYDLGYVLREVFSEFSYMAVLVYHVHCMEDETKSISKQGNIISDDLHKKV